MSEDKEKEEFKKKLGQVANSVIQIAQEFENKKLKETQQTKNEGEQKHE